MAKFIKMSIGPSVEVKPLSVTENGTFTAPDGQSYSPVDVAVAPTVEPITITENGVYPVPKGGGSLEFGKEYKFKEVITVADVEAYISKATVYSTEEGTVYAMAIDESGNTPALPIVVMDMGGGMYTVGHIHTEGDPYDFMYAINLSAITGQPDGWFTGSFTPISYADVPAITIPEGATMSADLATTAIFFDVETKALDGWGDITVNVAGGGGGGIIDVETLPTENIDENAVYRTTETVAGEPNVYMIGDGVVMPIAEVLAMYGMSATVTITLVSELPETMTPVVMSEHVLFPIYVLESDGMAYTSMTGSSADAMPFGMVLSGQSGMDKGWSDDINSETEQGIYSVRGEDLAVSYYWNYRDDAWAEFAPVVDVTELPTENVALNTCYHVIEPDKYFVYQNDDWLEWSKGPGIAEFISGDGTGTLKLPDGTTKIAPYACYGRQYDYVIIPSTVVTIGEKAFQECPNLKVIEFVEPVSVDTSVNGVMPEEFVDPYCLLMIRGRYVGREGIVYSGNMDDSGTFYWKIDDDQVRSEDVHIVAEIDGVPTRIGYSAFNGNDYIKTVEIAHGISSIGQNAFGGCSSLTNVTIPVSVSSIESQAFQICTNLTVINYLGMMEQWNAITFGSEWNYDTGNYTIHCTDGDIAKS